MKSQIFNKEYVFPKCWTDDDICKFKYYLEQSKLMFPKLDESLITLAIEHQINLEKGLVKEINKDDIKNIKVETPYFEELNTVIDVSS
jgi:hypothetical protein